MAAVFAFSTATITKIEVWAGNRKDRFCLILEVVCGNEQKKGGAGGPSLKNCSEDSEGDQRFDLPELSFDLADYHLNNLTDYLAV